MGTKICGCSTFVGIKNVGTQIRGYSKVWVLKKKLILKNPVSTPFDDRKSHICDKLEDEFHFLFECSLYTDLRKQYISRYFIVSPSMYKLTQLFKTDVKRTIRNVSIPGIHIQSIPAEAEYDLQYFVNTPF